MSIWFVIALLVVGLPAGFIVGTGNYGSILGAIAPGIIGGLLVAIPAIRERQYALACGIAAVALIGSIIAHYTPDKNGVKRFFREQRNLHVRVGSYQLGSDPGSR